MGIKEKAKPITLESVIQRKIDKAKFENELIKIDINGEIWEFKRIGIIQGTKIEKLIQEGETEKVLAEMSKAIYDACPFLQEHSKELCEDTEIPSNLPKNVFGENELASIYEKVLKSFNDDAKIKEIKN